MPQSNPTPARNRFSQEKSPYLRQHQNNPVDWYPWGTDAFNRARELDRPIFLSIGYSTCYWCHVMEKDSFEREEVAQVLNDHFVAIKVDREERPDVDALYMEAVQLMSGHGGWPMSVFLTPDLQPFYGATFFYRAQFINLLLALSRAWRDDRSRIMEAVAGLHEALTSEGSQTEPFRTPDLAAIDAAIESYKDRFDRNYGGFGRAPKFPPSQQISLIVRTHLRRNDRPALEMVEKTLVAMAQGGIYDQLGGGFHRYSTDEQWLVPHFEKMLYDNALLAVTYLDAYRVTSNQLCAQVAVHTLDYMLRDLSDPSGGFFSAEDAGEVDKEGEFYTWSCEEIRNLLTHDEYLSFSKLFALQPEGNFEHGKNILHVARDAQWEDRYDPVVDSALQKLLTAREARVRPFLDDKILTSWNGLAISALCRGWQVVGEVKFRDAAVKCGTFLRASVWRDGKLLHRYKDGDAAISGLAEDYAYLILGVIDLFESTFDPAWLAWALELQEAFDRELWDTTRLGYLFSRAPELIVKRHENLDGAIPAPSSIAVENLLRLFAFTGETDYRQRAIQTIASVGERLREYPQAFPRLLQGVFLLHVGIDEVAIVLPVGICDPQGKVVHEIQRGSEFNTIVTVIKKGGAGEELLPSVMRAREVINGRITYYVCHEGRCEEPSNEWK